MWKNESHNSSLSTEQDLKKVASYTQRRDFIRSHFDKNYTGTTRENALLLKKNAFQKAYLERFSNLKNTSRKVRMNLVKDRPEKNSQVQNIRENLVAKISWSLGEIFQGINCPVRSISDRIMAWKKALDEYAGKVMRQFSSVKLTGYFPPPKWWYKSKNEAKMEGWSRDKTGKPLYTLEQYLQWKAPYVSIAGHKSIPYGTRVRLANLEAQYGRPIECRVVDTWSAFNKQAPFSKLDVCVRGKESSHSFLVNTRTLVQQIA